VNKIHAALKNNPVRIHFPIRNIVPGTRIYPLKRRLGKGFMARVHRLKKIKNPGNHALPIRIGSPDYRPPKAVRFKIRSGKVNSMDF
jgi:hypothetical protein